MTISTARAKQLCTASELTLVKSSSRAELSKLSAARLKQKITRARKLRDKWRDQAMRQRRATQSRQQARATDDSARSAEKAELFGEVLDRFTTQLENVEGGGKVGPRLNPPRKSRTAQHREQRAAVRKSLEESRKELAAEASSRKTAGKKSAGKKSGGKKSAKKSAATGSSTDAQSSENSPPEPAGQSTSAAKPAQKQRKTAAKHTMTRPLEAGRKAQELKVTKKSQLESRTAAKRDRIKISGQVRTQKHLSATNKRRQARRDSK